MSLTLEQLHDLPSPFYRVAIKALIMDEDQRLLVAFNSAGHYEIPGGGWEHGESLEACLQRETHEELGVNLTSISPVLFAFQGESDHGWKVVRVVVRAELVTKRFHPGDDLVATKFVTKDEFPNLDFVRSDENIKNYIDQIWS